MPTPISLKCPNSKSLIETFHLQVTNYLFVKKINLNELLLVTFTLRHIYNTLQRSRLTSFSFF